MCQCNTLLDDVVLFNKVQPSSSFLSEPTPGPRPVVFKSKSPFFIQCNCLNMALITYGQVLSVWTVIAV